MIRALGMVITGGALWGAAVSGQEASGEALVENYLSARRGIATLRCDIRRETQVDGKRINTLSRVWFARPDRLRVESVVPEPRRIVVDGTAIHKWMDGDAQGVRIPLGEALESELVQVRKTPGTAEEYLLRLRGLPAHALPAADGFAVRRGYRSPSPHPYTVLAFDEKGRLARLEYFDSPEQTNRLVQINFGGWKEPRPGIWFACVQKTTARGRDGTDVTETLRVGALEVNEPIAPALFDVARQATGVHFVSAEEMSVILQRDGAPARKDDK